MLLLGSESPVEINDDNDKRMNELKKVIIKYKKEEFFINIATEALKVKNQAEIEKESNEIVKS